MNGKQISKLLYSHPATRNIFKGVYSINSRFPNNTGKDKTAIVINTAPSWSSGDHWVGVFKDANNAIYFDSYGRPPPLLLHDYLGKNYSYSETQLQSLLSTVCGQYCIAFILLMCKGKSLRFVVQSLDQGNKILNDHLVNSDIETIFNVDLNTYTLEHIATQISRAFYDYN